MLSLLMSVRKLKRSRSAPFSSCSSSICEERERGASVVRQDHPTTLPGESHVFVVVGADLSLQQGQQGVQAAGEFLLLHLRKQAANLSAESLEAGLGSGVKGQGAF